MQIVLDGVTTSVSLDKEKNMLDAARRGPRRSVQLPWRRVPHLPRETGQGKGHDERELRVGAFEVERGYVLTCQAHVDGDEDVVLDFDRQ